MVKVSCNWRWQIFTIFVCLGETLIDFAYGHWRFSAFLDANDFVTFLPQQNILLGFHHLFLCSKAQRTWHNCLDLQQNMNCNVWILELMLPLNH